VAFVFAALLLPLQFSHSLAERFEVVHEGLEHWHRWITLGITVPLVVAVPAIGVFAYVISEAMQVQCDALGFAWPLLEKTNCLNGSFGYLPAVIAMLLIGAWLAGETHLAAQYAAKLNETVHGSDVRCLRYLAGVASGRPSEPADDDMPQYVMYGRLMALAIASDFRERSALAHDALQAGE